VNFILLYLILGKLFQEYFNSMIEGAIVLFYSSEIPIQVQFGLRKVICYVIICIIPEIFSVNSRLISQFDLNFNKRLMANNLMDCIYYLWLEKN